MNAKTANEIPISALHLSARTYNALSNDGIETVADLVQYSHLDLLSFETSGAAPSMRSKRLSPDIAQRLPKCREKNSQRMRL